MQALMSAFAKLGNIFEKTALRMKIKRFFDAYQLVCNSVPIGLQ